MPTRDELDLLHALSDELAADAMSLTDDEAMGEGVDVEKERNTLMAAAVTARKRRRLEARAGFERATRDEAQRPRSRPPRDEMLRRMKAFIATQSGAEQQLTIAFRDAEGGLEEDVDSLFDDFVALGMDADEPK